jgi:hypothetical protein
MKLNYFATFFIVFYFTLHLNGQNTQRFLDSYNFYQKQVNGKINEYPEIKGSAYLFDDFKEGLVYLKDTSVTKLMLRYNLYDQQMEYEIKGARYIIGSPDNIDKIVLQNTTFIYLSFIEKKSYFELLVSGKSSLVVKYSVKLNPSKPPEPFKEPVYANFERVKDVFCIVNKNGYFEINNSKAIIKALNDKEKEIQDYIDKEKIKKLNKENILKIVNFYNGL